MPQFIIKKGTIPLVWTELYEEGQWTGIVDEDSQWSGSIHLSDDDPKSRLNIQPLKEPLPDFSRDVSIRQLKEFLDNAVKESERLLKLWGVPDHELRRYGLVPIFVPESGQIPAGVYAAARIIELEDSVSFDTEADTTWGMHNFGLIVQYAFSGARILEADLISRAAAAAGSKGGKASKKNKVLIDVAKKIVSNCGLECSLEDTLAWIENNTDTLGYSWPDTNDWSVDRNPDDPYKGKIEWYEGDGREPSTITTRQFFTTYIKDEKARRSQ